MIPAIDPINISPGDGSTTRFDFDFLINSTDELSVVKEDSLKNLIPLVCDTDYSVHKIGDKNGSYITFPITGSTHQKLQPNENITRSLKLKYEQQSVFSENGSSSGNLNMKILQDTVDYITRLIQILKIDVNRTLKLPIGTSMDSDTLINAIISAGITVAPLSQAAQQAATEAQGYAAGLNLPSAVGNSEKYPRQKTNETGFEYRTPAQVLSDIGGVGSSVTTPHIANNVIHSSSLKPQVVNYAKTTAGIADFIGTGTGLKPQILAASENCIGNFQHSDVQYPFKLTTDFLIPKDAPLNRRSSVVMKYSAEDNDYATNAALWDYSCQRMQFSEIFDTTENVLLKESGGVVSDYFGNTITKLGNPVVSGGEVVCDGAGDGII
jgi:hypothetical protein